MGLDVVIVTSPGGALSHEAGRRGFAVEEVDFGGGARLQLPAPALSPMT